MSDGKSRGTRSRRRRWPRWRVTLRRAWSGLVELMSFFGAATAAVGCVLIGRWPEWPERKSSAYRATRRRRTITAPRSLV